MSKKAIFVLALGSLTLFSYQTVQEPRQYDDSQLVEQVLNTLPDMAQELVALGIEISPANYIWPAEAALHPKALALLEKNGFTTLKREGLLHLMRAWFLMNYDSLNSERLQFIDSFSEQITQNPYLTDDQKRINIRLLIGELGLSKEELGEKVTEQTIKNLRPYSVSLKQMWSKVRREEL